MTTFVENYRQNPRFSSKKAVSLHILDLDNNIIYGDISTTSKINKYTKT